MIFVTQRERSTVPWDVLVNRLDRYLRIGYVSAALAGLVLSAEVIVRALSGSPQQRRQEIADAATALADWKPNAVLIVVVVAAAVYAVYVIGVACRTLSFAVTVALLNVVNPMADWVVRWWRGGNRDADPDAQPGARRALDEMVKDLEDLPNLLRDRWRRARGLPRRSGERKRYHWTRVPRDVGRSLLAPVVPPITRSDDVLRDLHDRYHAETVNRVLARHPIKVRVVANPLNRDALQEAEYNVYRASDYCQLWLQRYARDVAFPAGASRFLVLGTAALPAILLPKTLRLVGGDLDLVQSLLAPLWWLLWFGAIVLFLGVALEGRSYAVQTFQRFALVELAEASHRQMGRGESDPPTGT
jgi:hypothetical protein